MSKTNWHHLVFIVILVLGFFARIVYLPDILTKPSSIQFSFKSLTNPIADWHSWRQADTASVSRELLNGNATWLIPEYHDLSNIPSGKENPEGYRMVEFPLYNLVSVWVTQLLTTTGFPADIVSVSRGVSVAFSLITLLCLYLLVLNTSRDKLTALATAGFFAFLPFSVFYSRVILPEPTLVMLTTVSIFSFIKWIQANPKATIWQTNSWGWFIVSWITFLLALLVKPMAVFITPVFAVVVLYTYSWRVITKPMLWSFALTLLPLAAWRWWILQFPEGIPASKWLLNGNGIRLKPAWWRWLFADRLGRMIFGYWGLLFLALGAIVKSSKKWQLFDFITLSWAAGMLLYLIVFATGNVQHDYYQAILVPILSLLAGRGAAWLIKPQPNIYRPLAIVVAVFTTGLMMLFSWYEIGGFFNINNPAIVEAGQAVDQLTPPQALVIAPYQGDTAFLFQTNRRGWPIGFSIQERIDQGATHYITTSYDDEARELEARFSTVAKTDTYLLLELSSPLATSAATPVTQED